MPNYKLELVSRLPRRTSAPLLTPVGELLFNNLTYETKLNAIGSLQTSVKIDTLNDSMKARFRDLLNYPSELWLYKDGRIVYQGPLTNAQINSGTLIMYAHDLLYYTKYMFVTSDMRFDKVDQFTIMARLINQWQNQDYGNFGIKTTGNGLSGIRRDITYTAAENPNVFVKIEQMHDNVNGFDFTPDHANRRIHLGHPTLGEDKTDLVIFDRRNVSSTDIQMSVQAEDIASDAYGTGVSTNAEGEERIVRSHKFNEDVRKRFGKTGIADTFDGVSRQTTADSHTQKLLRDRDAMLFTPGPNLRPVGGVDVDDIDVGDKITYSYDAGLGLQTIQRRILARSVSITSGNEESLSVELS